MSLLYIFSWPVCKPRELVCGRMLLRRSGRHEKQRSVKRKRQTKILGCVLFFCILVFWRWCLISFSHLSKKTREARSTFDQTISFLIDKVTKKEFFFWLSTFQIRPKSRKGKAYKRVIIGKSNPMNWQRLFTLRLCDEWGGPLKRHPPVAGKEVRQVRIIFLKFCETRK